MATTGAEDCFSRTHQRRKTAVPPALVMLGLIVVSPGLRAQGPAHVDFGRDVQPIFKTYCIGCHGSIQQMNGFRLDRRRDAIHGGTIVVIGPGNSAGSRLYQRLIGDAHGMRMPPTGPLPDEKINIIKAWIDQGAEWPDALSGETPPPPPDPGATALMEALRRGDSAAFREKLKEDPKAANRKGPGGTTPLMYAALYGSADSVKRLLAAGADPNAHNEVGATALMWALNDLEKTRRLVDDGADVNARSDNGRTPLMIAATRRVHARFATAARSRSESLGAGPRPFRDDDPPFRGGLCQRRDRHANADRAWRRRERGGRCHAELRRAGELRALR